MQHIIIRCFTERNLLKIVSFIFIHLSSNVLQATSMIFCFLVHVYRSIVLPYLAAVKIQSIYMYA